ncbi:MAG: HEAT repeat domain-containing protein [Asgard group archaeon]|nr:HEAT repeat domain-containing protein [Asgard group archaeon]
MNSLKEEIKRLYESAYDFKDDDYLDESFLTRPEKICREIAKKDSQLLVPILKELFFENTIDDIQSLVILTLQNIKTNEATAFLLDRLKNDQNVENRSSAALYLAYRKGETVAEALTQAFLYDEKGEVRENAAFSLSIQKPPHWIDEFREQWKIEKDVNTRYRIAMELAKIDGEHSEFVFALQEMKEKGQLSDIQISSFNYLLEEFGRESMKEVHDVLGIFDEDDDDVYYNDEDDDYDSFND